MRATPLVVLGLLSAGCASQAVHRGPVQDTGHPPMSAAPTVAAAPDHAGDVATSAERAALERQIDRLRAATQRYRDHRNAVADGFRRFGRESALMGEHWYRADLVHAPLELGRPSTLQYAVIDGDRVLIGVAYTVYQSPGQPLPEGFAGAADHWHVHDVALIAQLAVRDRPLLRWIVDRRAARGRLGGGGGRTHLVMVHAWPWLDNPDGMFAQQHRGLPYLRAGLPPWLATHSDLAAAHGVALLTDWTCDRELERVSFLAQPGRSQKQVLDRACRDAASALAASEAWHALRRHAHAQEPGAAGTADIERFHAAAQAAWRGYERAVDRTLTAEQRQRLNALLEQPMAGRH